MQIQFLGANQTVTGSKHLLKASDKLILVDCGLFQGFKELRERNWEPFPNHAKHLDAVILTHAHIDHSGYLPLLVRQGFSGPIYCSRATYDLCDILLRDSAKLQEEDANRANKYGYSKHKPALPLYTIQDAERALQQFKTFEFGQDVAIGDEVKFHASHAGHILGSAIISVRHHEGTIVFSGDLGRGNDPIMKDPAKIDHADYLILESTYGNRLHPETDPATELEEIINSTIKKGGTVIIPSFAVGRAQTILYYLHKLKKEKRIPKIPIYLNSPMSQDATDIMCKYANEHKLSQGLAAEVCSTGHYTKTVEESKQLDADPTPKVIISASGMAEGGRILHHLKHYGGDPNSSIVFTGFQAPMTRGDRILNGAEEVKIHGEMHPIRARVERLESLSSHGDYEEILDWLKGFRKPPSKVFLTHGNIEACEAFRDKIIERFGWEVVIPEYKQTIDL